MTPVLVITVADIVGCAVFGTLVIGFLAYLGWDYVNERRRKRGISRNG